MEKGLSFSPTHHFDLYRTLLDINRLAHNITLKNHFQETPDEPQLSPLDSQGGFSISRTAADVLLYPVENIPNKNLFADLCAIHNLRSRESEGYHGIIPSPLPQVGNPDFYPLQSRPVTMDLFQDQVEEDLRSLFRDLNKSLSTKNNLSDKVHKALKELTNKDLIVRGADKGGVVVILNGGLYKKLNLTLLADQETNVELHKDPTSECQSIKKNLLDRGVQMGVLTVKSANKLFVTPTIPLFHSPPKVHKDLFPPPMCPIVAGIGSMGESLGQWIDALLKPLVPSLPPWFSQR